MTFRGDTAIAAKQMKRPSRSGRELRTGARICLTLLAVSVGACSQPEPDGQVVAVVNGEEITIPELNEEARARGVTIGENQAVRDQLLSELVDRKLLVQKALNQRMDRDPQHLLASRRLNEMLLSQALITSAAEDAQEREDPRQFIASRPYAFEKRALVSVELLSFPAVRTPELNRALDGAQSLEAAEQLLARARIDRTRTSEVWDSASLAPSWASKIAEGPPNRPVVLRSPDRTVVARVLRLVPQPVPKEQQVAFARELMRTAQQQRVLADVLQRLKSNAEIHYQREFAPKAGN
jgi:peptidyl-prolyl cis-trans isomerase C